MEWRGRRENPTREEIGRILKESAGVLRFASDWEKGLFTVSLEQYRRMPEVAFTARRVLSEARAERQTKP